MTQGNRGRDLFIVDNSVSGWTGLRYLEEWTGVAKAFDIATGYFEIGALLALDGKWQALDKIRILMGADMTHRTRKTLLEAVRERAVQVLDGSIEANKDANPFLHGVPALLEALRSGQIECRVYDRDKFYAKAYIKRHKDLKIPECMSPDQAFVQILDPATGTGTFLVEVIDIIHKTMVAKWKAQGHGEKKIEALWNELVPKHLLPRLHAYELLMAPYASSRASRQLSPDCSGGLSA